MSLLLLFRGGGGAPVVSGPSAAYTALLGEAVPEFVVLAEVQPMEPLQSWTAAGGGLTNTFYCSFVSHLLASAPTVLVGGLYRRLDFVRQDATTYTARASAALVDANLGSYFLDTATNRLYVSTTTGVTPDTFALVGAWFTLFFSSTSVSFSDQPLYSPLLTGSFPTISAEMPDTLFGSTISAAGSVSLINYNSYGGIAGGLFYGLSKRFVWRNKKVTFKLGGARLAYADYQTLATLRINGIDVDDELAILQLEDAGNILNQSLPKRTWGEGVSGPAGGVPAPTQDIGGQSQPLIFGTIYAAPLALGSRVAGVSDSWYAFDFNVGPYGSCTFDAVYWLERATNTGGLMTPGTDYTISAGVVTVHNPAYFSETHSIVATLTQLGTASNPTFGTMARAILEICGEDPASIDAAAFADVTIAAPQILARYVGAPVQAVDLMRELEQSVNGQVYQGADGRWTCRILSLDANPNAVDLSEIPNADFITWNTTGELRSVLNEVRVRYLHYPLTDSWREVSASSDAVRYGSETRDSHRLDTWLQVEADATAHAHHLQFLRSSAAATIRVRERGLKLMTSAVGDLVTVTRNTAPIARTPSYNSHYLRIVKLDKALGPEAPNVTAWLNDLEGQTDRIFRLAPSGSTLTWATAVEAQKARYGFLSNMDRYINPVDPASRRDAKVLV